MVGTKMHTYFWRGKWLRVISSGKILY